MTRTPKALAASLALALMATPVLANTTSAYDQGEIEDALEEAGFLAGSMTTQTSPDAPYKFEVTATKGGLVYDLFLNAQFEIVLTVEK